MKNQKGIAPLLVLIAISSAVIIGFAGYKVWNSYIKDVSVDKITSSLNNDIIISNANDCVSAAMPWEVVDGKVVCQGPGEVNYIANCSDVPQADCSDVLSKNETQIELPDGWAVYNNSRYDYKIGHPKSAAVSLAKYDSFTYQVDSDGSTSDPELDNVAENERLSFLYKKYTGSICTTIRYQLGYVNISAPVNQQNGYVICSPTGVGASAKYITDTVEIGGEEIEAGGYSVNDPRFNNLKYDSIYYSLNLKDGTRITYGSISDPNATLTDWQKQKKELKKIISTYTKTTM